MDQQKGFSVAWYTTSNSALTDTVGHAIVCITEGILLDRRNKKKQIKFVSVQAIKLLK